MQCYAAQALEERQIRSACDWCDHQSHPCNYTGGEPLLQ